MWLGKAKSQKSFETKRLFVLFPSHNLWVQPAMSKIRVGHLHTIQRNFILEVGLCVRKRKGDTSTQAVKETNVDRQNDRRKKTQKEQTNGIAFEVNGEKWKDWE